MAEGLDFQPSLWEDLFIIYPLSESGRFPGYEGIQIKHHRKNHPLYWAVFISVGNGSITSRGFSEESAIANMLKKAEDGSAGSACYTCVDFPLNLRAR